MKSREKLLSFLSARLKKNRKKELSFLRKQESNKMRKECIKQYINTICI